MQQKKSVDSNGKDVDFVFPGMTKELAEMRREESK